jgi:hypothetical protein
MKRNYQGIKLCKREIELIQFLQSGSNNFKKAFYIYKHRKQRIKTDTKVINSWFNRTLLSLHKKSLMLNIPFIWNGIKWMNPGVEASKANLIIEQKIDYIREINISKPIL